MFGSFPHVPLASDQGKLDEERHQVTALKQHQEHLEDDLKGYKIRTREYEEGLYGLPQVCDRHEGRSECAHVFYLHGLWKDCPRNGPDHELDPELEFEFPMTPGRG